MSYLLLSMDTSQYKTLFLQEAEEHLKGISEELLKLENEPHAPSGIDNLFRHFHSIKGMAASMGYEAMAGFSHQLEDLLDAVRKKKDTTQPGDYRRHFKRDRYSANIYKTHCRG